MKIGGLHIISQKKEDKIGFLKPDVHDDSTLEKGRNVKDSQEKSVCDLVHLVQINYKHQHIVVITLSPYL